METEEGNLFFCVAFIRLLPEVSVPRSLKVPELWTLQSGIKAVQWYHRQTARSGMCRSYVFGKKTKNEAVKNQGAWNDSGEISGITGSRF